MFLSSKMSKDDCPGNPSSATAGVSGRFLPRTWTRIFRFFHEIVAWQAQILHLQWEIHLQCGWMLDTPIVKRYCNSYYLLHVVYKYINTVHVWGYLQLWLHTKFAKQISRYVKFPTSPYGSRTLSHRPFSFGRLCRTRFIVGEILMMRPVVPTHSWHSSWRKMDLVIWYPTSYICSWYILIQYDTIS